MTTLQLLANCYKHAPSQRPETALLKHLGLDGNRNYASLPDSRAFRERLALSLKLGRDADYCDVVEEFLKRVEAFLAKVQEQPQIGKVDRGHVSLRPRDAEC